MFNGKRAFGAYEAPRGQLSRSDYIAEREKPGGLKIIPYNAHCQKAASYDLTPTIIAMSSKCGMLETVYREKKHKEDKYYIYVHPKDTVLIISNECLMVPPNIAGYVSSRVSKVVEGFGHISTTIDPNWFGAGLIAVSNPSNQMLKIYVGISGIEENPPNQLATVTFHYLNTPCTRGDVEQLHRGMRLDLLKRVNYKNKPGFRAWVRKWVHMHRREFTEYFFAVCEVLEQEVTEESWEVFLNDFSRLTAPPPRRDDVSGSRKAQKCARDFVVTENALIRAWHFVIKHKTFFILLLAGLLSLAWFLSVPRETAAQGFPQIIQGFASILTFR